jgi:hypothetical protein
VHNFSRKKPEGRRPLGRPRYEDNIRMNLMGRMGRCKLESSGSGQGQFACSCEYGNERSGSIKGGDFLNN